MNNFYRIILTLLLLLISPSTYAQIDSGLLDRKIQLEEKLSQRLREKIETTLSKDSFEITVQLVVEEYKPKESKPADRDKKETSTVAQEPTPQDLTLGLLDAEKVLQEYRSQIKALEESKKTVIQMKDAEKTFYRIKNVIIFAGLREELGADYAKEFEAWLNKSARAEFGSKVVVNLRTIRLPDVLKVTKAPLDPLDTRSLFKDYQALFATALFALTILLATLIWKLLLAREAESKRKFLLEMQQLGNQNLLKALGAQDDNEEKEKNSEALQITATADLKNIQELNSKIVLLLKNVDIRMQDVIESWTEQSERGFIKCALFLDALLGSTSTFKDGDTHLEYIRSLDFPKESREAIFETLTKMGTIAADVRLKHLEELYWELLAAQTVDPQLLNEPYSFLEQMGEREIIEVLNEQPDNLQPMYLLTMPKLAQGKVMRELSLEKKRNLVQLTLETDEVSESEVVSLSDALKLKFKAKTRGETKIKTLSVLPEILSSLSILEQVRFLREFSYKFPVKISALKDEYLSLAFMADWTDSFFRRYVESVEAEHLLGLILVMPSLQERIMTYAPEISKKIINDEMSRNTKLSDEALERLFDQCQVRLNQLLERSQKKVSEIYEPSAVASRLAS